MQHSCILQLLLQISDLDQEVTVTGVPPLQTLLRLEYVSMEFIMRLIFFGAPMKLAI